MKGSATYFARCAWARRTFGSLRCTTSFATDARIHSQSSARFFDDNLKTCTGAGRARYERDCEAGSR